MNKASPSFRKVFLVAVGLAAISAGSYLAYHYWQGTQLEGPAAPTTTPLEEITTENVAPVVATEPSLPEELNIQVPFYTQAPLSNWDYPWQDACEEASVALIANVYLQKNWTREEFNQQLLDLVDWQGKNGMDYHDTTIAETAEFMKVNYGLDSIVHENPTFEDIQSILAQGHLIIGAFAGKMLHNPNFTNGGPIYHMLVIKGYDAAKKQIVTNDVGTRKGADYVYDWDTIKAALHEWNATDITLGAQLILEVLPPQS